MIQIQLTFVFVFMSSQITSSIKFLSTFDTAIPRFTMIFHVTGQLIFCFEVVIWTQRALKISFVAVCCSMLA